MVEVVGENVSDFHPGQAVFGDLSSLGRGGFGGLAEYVSARQDVLTSKLPSLSYEEAAAISQAGLLAFHGPATKGGVKQGDKFPTNGATEGVGTVAVQLAKSWGTDVIAVDSAEELES